MPLSALSGPPQVWEIVTFSGNIILSIEDAFDYLISQDGAGQTVTIPPNTDVAFAVGTQMSFKQGGAGVITFAPGAGVTIQSRDTLLASNGQFAVASIVQDSANIWSLFGDLV